MQIIFAFLIFQLSQPTFASSFKFNCYQGKVSTKESNIEEIRFAWSTQKDWNSIIFFKDKKGKFYSQDALCLEFPIKSGCPIFDDGGLFQVEQMKTKANKKKYGDIMMTLIGLPTTENTGNYDEQRLIVKAGKPNMVIAMKQVNKKLCKYKYD